MLHLIKLLSKNPITKWMQWMLLRYRLKKLNGTLSFGYMSKAVNSSFSTENHIFPFVNLYKVKLGNFTYVGGNTNIKNASVGHFTSIASDCRIGLGIHPTNFVSTHPLFYSSKHQWSVFPENEIDFDEYKDIKIGNDVWIGTRVVIIDGIKIGNGAIVAAGAVVTKDVEPYSIVGGIPAKFIKYRFCESKIKELQSIKWWDWNIQKIKKNINFFTDSNNFTEDFIE